MKKGPDRENNATIKDQEKEIQKGRKKVKETGKHGETKKNDNKSTEEEQMEEVKRQKRHSKRKNVEKVFLGEKSEESKKKGSYKLSKHNFSMKKQFFLKKRKTGRKRKHKGRFHPLKI